MEFHLGMIRLDCGSHLQKLVRSLVAHQPTDEEKPDGALLWWIRLQCMPFQIHPAAWEQDAFPADALRFAEVLYLPILVKYRMRFTQAKTIHGDG